ncbi:MAG: hypothetical protein KBG49_12820 [Spirochaetes bacterium]|nr:hypothetical protein [Spirochaetota bacterium]
MKKRWLDAAILQSEERMHRLSGFMSIKPLIKSMEKVLSEEKIELTRRVFDDRKVIML